MGPWSRRFSNPTPNPNQGVCFVGRLASYKYFNMDQAILNALEIYDNMKETGKLAPLALALTLAPALTLAQTASG